MEMTRENIMNRWDEWRRAISNGDRGSWPRDEFEMLLDWYDEQLEEAKDDKRRD